jgi:hypothetical protein
LKGPTGAFVGEHYANGILFVGINHYPAEDLFEFYAPYQDKWFSTTNGTGMYRAVYRLTCKILKKQDWEPSESREYIACSNVVKCSVGDDAGNPPPVMSGNCEKEKEFLHKEVEILQPRLIVCLGQAPFSALERYYMHGAPHQQDAAFRDWTFQFDLNGQLVSVLRLHNPGRYQSINEQRNTIKAINDNEQLPADGFRRFLPREVETGAQLKVYLARTYDDTKNLVKLDDPYYEMIIDRLLAEAKVGV